MHDYDLYSIEAESIDDAMEIVKNILLIDFIEHESLYLGGVYFSTDCRDGEDFSVLSNRELIDDEPMESDFPDPEYILYVNRTNRGNELRQSLENCKKIKFLKKENVLICNYYHDNAL